MPSSKDDNVEEKSSLNKALFVKLLLTNPTICEKLQIPSTVAAKKISWDTVSDEYSSVMGKEVAEIEYSWDKDHHHLCQNDLKILLLKSTLELSNLSNCLQLAIQLITIQFSSTHCSSFADAHI